MGLLGLLFGKNKRPEIVCKKCGKSGNLYLEGGVINKGQFKILGKDENAKLLVQCDSCHTKLRYDPLWSKVEEYDELKEIAKGFGLKV